MPQVGFEPTIPVFERVKTVHDLGRAASVTENFSYSRILYIAFELLFYACPL
jgi:hypothetical protein